MDSPVFKSFLAVEPQPPRELTPIDAWRYFGNVSDLFYRVSKQSSGSTPAGKMTLNQARICGHIFEHHAEKIRLKNLARTLGVTSAAVSQTVESLVRAGLVDRTPDPDDRRAVLIRISAKGRRLLMAWQTAAERLMAELYEGVPPEDADAFFRVLRRLNGELDRRWNALIADGAAGR